MLLLLPLVTTALTSSAVGMVDFEAAKGRRLELKDALRVPGMYVAGGRISRKSFEDSPCGELLECCAIAAE